MIEITGDIINEAYNAFDRGKRYDAICCTTNMIVKNNGELVMGAGVAKRFKEKYPNLPRIWGERIKNREHMHGFIISSGFPSSFFVAFPTKRHWKDKSDIQLIKESTVYLLNATRMLGWKRVLLPRPGCSNGGLRWDEVKPHLEKYLDDRFYIITKE